MKKKRGSRPQTEDDLMISYTVTAQPNLCSLLSKMSYLVGYCALYIFSIHPYCNFHYGSSITFPELASSHHILLNDPVIMDAASFHCRWYYCICSCEWSKSSQTVEETLILSAFYT